MKNEKRSFELKPDQMNRIKFDIAVAELILTIENEAFELEGTEYIKVQDIKYELGIVERLLERS